MASGYIEDVSEITRLTRAQNFLPDSSNAKLSTTQILAIAQSIARTDIDPKLRILGATTPIAKSTSPSGFFILKDINALGAACRVDRIIFTEERPSGRDDRPWQCMEFDKFMTSLLAGEIDLIDVPNMIVKDEDLATFTYENDRYFTYDDTF